MIIRSTDVPHKLALGVAIGLCCGVAIPLGQMLLAILLAFIFKANKILAAAATFISNPYTTPIIYPFFCYLGIKNNWRRSNLIEQIFRNLLTA